MSSDVADVAHGSNEGARLRAVDDAVGSLRAEGLEPSPIALELARRHVVGELTARQVEAMLRAYHASA
jgi:hypothetical protein